MVSDADWAVSSDLLESVAQKYFAGHRIKSCALGFVEPIQIHEAGAVGAEVTPIHPSGIGLGIIDQLLHGVVGA